MCPAKSTNSFSPASVHLAQRRLQPPDPGPIEIAEPGVAEPVRGRRRGILPKAAPASCSAAAARDAPPPNPAPAAAPSAHPAAADTAAPRAARHRAHPAAASPGPPAEPGSDSRSPPLCSAADSARSPAGSVRARTAGAEPRVSSASTISRPAFPIPCCSAKDRDYPWLKTVSGSRPATTLRTVFMITGTGVHDPPESVFRINWNRCSRSNGIRVHDRPERAIDPSDHERTLDPAPHSR